MNINKNNFFWYIFTLTTCFVIIYFLFFSGKIYQYKFVHNKLSGNVILKSFKDYKQLQEGFDLYKKLYSEEIIKLSEIEDHAKQIFSNIIRFAQTNKNYKYEYKNFKKLNEEEFKHLEKIINNVSLEGAYFLTPEHIDKVTINLFLSKKNQKTIFLDYYKYVIDNEVDKYFQNVKSVKTIYTESTYAAHVSEINMIRDLHYSFLSYVKNIIYENEKNINININTEEYFSNNDIDELLNYLECPYYYLGTVKVSCPTLTDEIVKKLSNFYLKLNSINIFDIAISENDTKLDNLVREVRKKLNNKSKRYVKKNSLFEELISRWIVLENYNLEKFFQIIQRGFSEKYIEKIQQASLLRDSFNLLDSNFDYRFINSKNYNLDEIKKTIFSNIDEVEFRRNYLELIPYLSFALIFSLISHIVYRSFSDK